MKLQVVPEDIIAPWLETLQSPAVGLLQEETWQIGVGGEQVPQRGQHREAFQGLGVGGDA